MSGALAGRLAVDQYDHQRVRGAVSAGVGIDQLAFALVVGVVVQRVPAEIKRRELPPVGWLLESSGPPINFSTTVLLMPISSLANLLLAAGVPKISPSTLPSLDFTFRPSVLAGAGAGFEPLAA